MVQIKSEASSPTHQMANDLADATPLYRVSRLCPRLQEMPWCDGHR